MKFITFAIVATFFSLVVANPATDNIDEVEKSETDCTGRFCYNARTQVMLPCCLDSYCDFSGGLGMNYCAWAWGLS